MRRLLRELAAAPINEALALAVGGVLYMLFAYFALPTWRAKGFPYWGFAMIGMALGLFVMGIYPYVGLGMMAMAVARLMIEYIPGMQPQIEEGRR